MVKRRKPIPVTSHGVLQGCEASRLPHLLDNRLTDGCEADILTSRPHLYPQEGSWYSFLLEAELTPITSSGIEPTTFRLEA
jgi:hypothetical protein